MKRFRAAVLGVSIVVGMVAIAGCDNGGGGQSSIEQTGQPGSGAAGTTTTIP